MVNSLRLEPLREFVNLVVVHLEGPLCRHLALDVLNRLLKALLANF